MERKEQSRARLEFVDALRGIAFLGVLAVHAMYPDMRLLPRSNLPNDRLADFADLGSYGVQMFYVASAFTLFLSLAGRANVGSREELRNFFVRRFFRIAPLFYVALAFYLWRDGMGPRYYLGDAPGLSAANIVSTLFFCNGWHPEWINSTVPGGWSVAVEMQFYLLVPLLFLWIRTLRHAVIFLCVSLLVAMLSRELLVFHSPLRSMHLWFSFLSMWLPNQMPIFGLGIALFFLFRPLLDARSRFPSAAWCASGLLLALFLGICWMCAGSRFLYVPLLMGVGCVCLAAALILHPWPLLVNRFTRGVGTVSYSAYLTHFAVLPLCNSALLALTLSPRLHYFALYGVSLIITLGLSAITYRLVELPGIALGKRIQDHVRRPLATVSIPPRVGYSDPGL